MKSLLCNKEIQSSRQTTFPHAQYPHCTTYSASSCTIGCTSSWTGTRHQTKPSFDEDTGSLDSNLGLSRGSYTQLNTKAFGKHNNVKKVGEPYIKLLQRLSEEQGAQVRTDTKSCEFKLLRSTKQGDPLSSLLFQHAHAQDVCEWKEKTGESRSETLKARSSQTSDLQVTFRVFLQHSHT